MQLSPPAHCKRYDTLYVHSTSRRDKFNEMKIYVEYYSLVRLLHKKSININAIDKRQLSKINKPANDFHTLFYSHFAPRRGNDIPYRKVCAQFCTSYKSDWTVWMWVPIVEQLKQETFDRITCAFLYHVLYECPHALHSPHIACILRSEQIVFISLFDNKQ